MKFIPTEWPAPASIHAFTTTRQSFGEQNPKQEVETQKLCDLFSLPNKPLWINQTHGTKVVKADIKNLNSEADASYSDQPQQVCVVLTADCLPLLICNKKGTHVAAIHAGWRGLSAGIIERTIEELALPSDELLVWLGPAIGPDRFEVGKDVLDAFLTYDPAAQTAFKPKSQEKWHANLYELARMRLNAMGIHAIYGGSYCTHSQEDLFFSYRRDKNKEGRMASLIWIA